MVAKGEIFLNDPSPKSNLAFFYHPRIIERQVWAAQSPKAGSLDQVIQATKPVLVEKISHPSREARMNVTLDTSKISTKGVSSHILPPLLPRD
jgi:hypothetical protein